jgi:hypothetical protein
MGNQFTQSCHQGLGLGLRFLVRVGSGDVDVDLEATGEMIRELNVELAVRTPGDSGDDRTYLGGLEVERRNNTDQTEACRRFAGNEDICPRLDAGCVQIAGHPAGGGGQ